MKTLILIMFIFFVFKMLSEAAKKHIPRQDLPEFRTSGGDDAPLSGPWNRRTETGAESSLPGSWDIPAEPNGDAPLPGPWERKSPREQSVESRPRWETEFEPEPAYEPGPVREKRRKPQSAARPRDRAVEPVTIPEQRRSTDMMDAPVLGRSAYVGHSDECEVVGLQDRRAAAMQEPMRRERKRRRRADNPLAAVLSCHTTLVGSMVLGQVLGTRGGRKAERRKSS